MREDMYKVIVERPRRGGGVQGEGRNWRFDGVVMVWRHWPPPAAWVPVREHSYIALFVHPVTGILLPNRGQHQARRRQRQQWAQRRTDQPYAEYHVIDDATQWHRVDGCWFEVTLAPLPSGTGAEAQRYDVLRRCKVSRAHASQAPAPGAPATRAMYGQDFVYAAAKRQLSRREVQARLGDGR